MEKNPFEQEESCAKRRKNSTGRLTPGEKHVIVAIHKGKQASLLLPGKNVICLLLISGSATPEKKRRKPDMKKVYEAPAVHLEQFVANEYIAACGDENLVYKFKCDAGSRRKEYHVYLNGPDGEAHTSDDIDWSGRSGRIKPYSPCGTTHEAIVDSDFQAGYMYEYGWRGDSGDPINVVVWTNNGTNTHCTSNLNIDSWETDKS